MGRSSIVKQNQHQLIRTTREARGEDRQRRSRQAKAEQSRAEQAKQSRGESVYRRFQNDRHRSKSKSPLMLFLKFKFSPDDPLITPHTLRALRYSWIAIHHLVTLS